VREGEKDHFNLTAGAKFDLKARKVVAAPGGGGRE
jgi:hypothetical protein